MTPDYPKNATPAQVWSEPGRTLTGITGQPRTDLLGEDATFEAGAGTRKARIDKLAAFDAPTESSVVMDGTEKILFENTDVKSSELEAWLDFTTMAGGDTIVVRYYRKVKAAGAYVKYAEETYTGAQSIPLLCILSKKAYRDIKITAQQSAGVNRTLDVQVIRAKEA